jgi:glutaredoxin 3
MTEAQVNPSEIIMYSTTWCPYCDRARSLLKAKSASFIEVKIDEDPAQRDIMLKRTGGRRTVPQIFIGERHVGGFDELYALDRKGELDGLLRDAAAAGSTKILP